MMKNDTTIVITYPSGRIEVTLYKRDNFFNGAYYHKGERIPEKNIRLATKEDVDLYILNRQRQLDQLERELRSGL